MVFHDMYHAMYQGEYKHEPHRHQHKSEPKGPSYCTYYVVSFLYIEVTKVQEAAGGAIRL